MVRRFVVGGWFVALGASFLVLGGGCDDGDAPPSPAGNAGSAGNVGSAGAAGINGGGGSASVGPTIDQVPAQLAKIICDQQKRCLGPAYDVFLGGTDCESNFLKSIEDGDIGASKRLADQGKLTYDPAKAKSCLDGYAALTCEGLTNPAPSGCDEIFGGKGTAGSACTINAECVPGTFCRAANACPGVCANKIAEGGDCRQTDECAAGLKCSSLKCSPVVALGAACDEKRECLADALCLPNGGGDEARSCQLSSTLFAAAVGAACDPAASIFCVPTATCELQSFSVAGGAVFGCAESYGSGKPCKYGFPDGCPDDEYCPTDFEAKPPVLEAVCTKRPAAGEPCGRRGNEADSCAPNDVCDQAADKKSGTCLAKQRLGNACTKSAGCYSGVCKAGVCAEGLACEPRGP